MTRHSHQAALTDTEYEQLLTACDQLDEPYQTEARFAVIATGRLGLRGGELAHLSKDWINWDRSQIEIPAYDACTNGTHGGVCGYCKQQAALAVENNDDLDMETAVSQRWNPKTDHAVRAVPFDFNDRVRKIVSDFFWTHNGWEHSRSTVNRRVKRAARQAGVDVFPHALRATAATYHAYQGVPPVALQNLFGWARLATAQKYIRLSGSATSAALRAAHGGSD